MIQSEGGSSGGKRGSQDFDINLAPIIDCFTVLITFLLVSASFLATGIFSAGAEVPGQIAQESQAPTVTLDLSIQEDLGMELKLSGKKTNTTSIAPKEQKLDLEALKAQLQNIKASNPDLKQLTLSGQNNVEYSNLIQVMESGRKVIANILLGGF